MVFMLGTFASLRLGVKVDTGGINKGLVALNIVFSLLKLFKLFRRKIKSEAATNEFTQWVEDRQADPAAPGFAPDEDADGDGVSNYDEYLADTDPTSSNSVLKLEGDYVIGTNSGTGQIEFDFPASSNPFS